MKPEPNQPILLTEKQAARILGLSIRTLQKWRMTGNGPKYIRCSARAIRYEHQHLTEFIEARVRQSTSDQGYVA